MTASRTRPLRSETRRRVLDAAFEVFAERGITASSLSDVAAAAGLTKGAVYSNFAGKDDLVLALMEEHVGQRLVATLEGVAQTDDAGQALANVGTALVRALHADSVWHRLLAEYYALSQHDPDRREALRIRRRESHAAIARVITQVATTLDIELPMPTDEFAVVLIALSNGLGIEAGIDPDAVPDDLLAKVLALIAGDAIAQAAERRARS